MRTRGFVPLYFGWSLGTLGMSALLNTQTAMLQYYLTSIIGIAPALAGTLIFAAKMYDGVTDPAMGVISDRTRSRWGRRRPWMLAGGLLCGVAVVAMFSLPPLEGWLLNAWVLGVLVLAATAYTMFNVPYLSMPAEMVDEPYERSKLMSYRVAWISLGSLIGLSVAPWLVALGRDRFGLEETEAYRFMGYAIGVLIVLATSACVWATRNARSTSRTGKRMPMAEQLRFLAGNRPFLLLLGIKYLGLFSLFASAGIVVFFVKHVMLRSEAILLWYGFAHLVGMLAGIPLWVLISKRLSKPHTLALSAGIYAIFHLTYLFSGPQEPLLVFYARVLVISIGSSGMLLMGQSLLPDVMEMDYRRTGLRREGIYAGLYSFIEKFAAATAPLLIGLTLGGLAFDRTATVQPPSAVTAILLLIAVVPAVLNLLKIVLALFLKIDLPDTDPEPDAPAANGRVAA